MVDGSSRKAVAVVRSLGRAGYEVVVTGHSHLATARGSKYCSRFVHHPEVGNDGRPFWAFMRAHLAVNHYDVILPMEGDALALFSSHRDELPAGTAFPFAPDAVLRRAANKHEVMRLASELGIPAPASRMPRGTDDLERVAAEIHFPAIIKPIEGQGSHGVKRIANLAELREWYPRIAGQFGPAVVQEFIPPEAGEFGTSALIGPGGKVLALFSHKRIRSYPISGGPSTLRESVRVPEMEADAIRLLQGIGWYGVAMVEFKRDPRDGRYKLIEINHRFWGSLQLAIVSGVDFPALLCRLALGEAVEPVREYRTGVQCRWLVPGDLLNFLTNPDRFKLEPSFFRFFGKDLHYDIASISDPMPMFTLLGATFMQSFSARHWKRVTKRESH